MDRALRLEPVTQEFLTERSGEFAGLLRDAVEHGASIGFTLPLSEAEVAEYWCKVGAELAGGNMVMFAARAAGASAEP